MKNLLQHIFFPDFSNSTDRFTLYYADLSFGYNNGALVFQGINYFLLLNLHYCHCQLQKWRVNPETPTPLGLYLRSIYMLSILSAKYNTACLSCHGPVNKIFKSLSVIPGKSELPSDITLFKYVLQKRWNLEINPNFRHELGAILVYLHFQMFFICFS